MTLLPTRRRLPRDGRRMGMTEVRVRVVNLADSSRFAEADMVVDCGAIYSVVPVGVLRRIGVEPRETQAFGLANGESVRREIGDVRCEIGDRSGAAPVEETAAKLGASARADLFRSRASVVPRASRG